MKFFFPALLLASFFLNASAQNIPVEKFTISGYVREAVSGESLIGVNIYLQSRQAGTVTNNYGFYSITLPASDTINLAFSYVGFTSRIIKLSLRKDVELNIELTVSKLLDEVTVSADRTERQSESVKMSTVKLQVAQIRDVPSLLGEKDVLKVLQLMPGIQKGIRRIKWSVCAWGRT